MRDLSNFDLRLRAEKCAQVVVLSAEKKALAKIQALVEGELDAEISQKVLCLTPEEFILFFDQANAEPTKTEKTVRGYKVKANYKSAPNAEQAAQRQAVAQVILQALKRL